jgi:hypothetical protein
MGWWATGHDDDMMGDEPLDILGGMFEFHAQMTDRKPSLQEVVDALAQMLRTDGDEMIADPSSLVGRRIEARLAGRPALASAAEAPIDDLLFGMASTLRQIARSYEEAGYDRKPRLSEILEAFTAVVQHEPERYLRETEGQELEAFALADVASSGDTRWAGGRPGTTTT